MNTKINCFLKIARFLNERFDITPLLFGSLGLEYLSGGHLDADDIDMLIPKVFLTTEWQTFQSALENEGFVLKDESEHTFEKDGILYAYADVEDLEPFAGIPLSEIKSVSAEGAVFKLLSFEQYLSVYQKSIQDGYRINVRQKKDQEKIEFIQNHLGECLICGAPLVYLEQEKLAECALCHKPEPTKTLCKEDHYICNECHTAGIDTIIGVCLAETSKNPITILRKLMALPFCHMHGPEHHIMVGSALLTAYKNAGGTIDLPQALVEMQSRGKKVPGGACGFWGACGAAVSAGMFVSIVTGSTPLANKAWALSNLMTSQALQALGNVGGPRCCKRNAYLAITEAVRFAQTHLDVTMESEPIRCIHSAQNNQCIGNRCPFH